MSGPFIPQEIWDLIIDHLHDDPETLYTCCLVSNAWVLRAKKHLFAKITFIPPDRHIPQWRGAFPDPATSPAHNVRTLSIRKPRLITTENTNTLLTFCGVTHLSVDTDSWQDRGVSLSPFHGFSPVVRSLRLATTLLRHSEIFDLICSFPLLEDLALIHRGPRSWDEDLSWNHPSTSPRLTGSLELNPNRMDGIEPTVHSLLNLPNGLHFKRISVLWSSHNDIKSTMDLVSSCSNTLESLDITNHFQCMFSTTTAPDQCFTVQIDAFTIDLSNAIKLRDIEFRCGTPLPQWIITTLRATNPENIQRITIYVNIYDTWPVPYPGWKGLDSLLVQFWDSYPICTRVVCGPWDGLRPAWESVERLLPEMTSRGAVDIFSGPPPDVSSFSYS